MEIFSNISHLPSPGVGVLKMNDFDDSLVQEFNHIGVIKLIITIRNLIFYYESKIACSKWSL